MSVPPLPGAGRGVGAFFEPRVAHPEKPTRPPTGPAPHPLGWKRRRVPRALNEAEETLALHLKAEGCVLHGAFAPGRRYPAGEWVRQWPLSAGADPTTAAAARAWRLDFAVPSRRIAVEVEGAPHRIKGRWQAGLERQRFEVALGWKVFRFTPAQVRDGAAIGFVRALRAAAWDLTAPAVLAALED